VPSALTLPTFNSSLRSERLRSYWDWTGEEWPLSHLTDTELEKISILLASGRMGNARKIVRLLNREPRDESRSNRDGMLAKVLGELLSAGALPKR